MRYVVACIVASTFMVAPAFAQSADEDFAGAHVEVISGFDSVSALGEDRSGLLFGGSLGYDVAAGKVLVGAEGELTTSSAKFCGGTLCVKSGRDLYAGGRLGYVVAKNLLVFVKAGYTNGRLLATNSINGVTTRAGENLDGVRGGVGIEFKIEKGLIGKVEYRYSNYEQDFSRHQVLAGLGVRF